MDTNNTTAHVSIQPEEDKSEFEKMDTSEDNWSWFYLAECGLWHMFEIDKQPAARFVTCSQIEQCYSRNQHGFMELNTHRLDFSAMKMINTMTGKQQQIKRSLHSETDFRFICENLALELINNVPYELIQLDRETYEFKEVAKLYDKTMVGHPIKSIQRIQNKHLWELFCRKKTQLRRELDIEERMLFHGTDDRNIEGICINNFDCRLAGCRSGSLFGKGIYFATDAKLSSRYTLPSRYASSSSYISSSSYTSSRLGVSSVMFLARVIVGEYTVGQAHYRRPPEVQTHNGGFLRFYDSCVDNVRNPQQYVIFDSNQIYPEYLIEFSKSKC